MKQVKKILFPIDFAENYDALLPWVSTFVEKFDATLYVIFVTQDLSSFSTFYVPHGNIKSFQEEALASAKKRMAVAVQEHFKQFPKIETVVVATRQLFLTRRGKMNTNRKAAILAGMLYFLGIIAGALSEVPVIDIRLPGSNFCKSKPGNFRSIFPVFEDDGICWYGDDAVSDLEKTQR